jgi:hypothetical protein
MFMMADKSSAIGAFKIAGICNLNMDSSLSTVSAFTAIYRKHGCSARMLYVSTFQGVGKTGMSFEGMWRRVPDSKWLNKAHSMATDSFYRYNDLRLIDRFRKSERYLGSYSDSPRVMAYVPSFNRAEYLLERSLPSIVNQSYSNIRIVVVDDGSTDGTSEKVKLKYGERVEVHSINRQKYRYPNKSIYHWYSGPVEAANYALSICDEHWIARIDDDDEWMPDHIEKSLNFAIAHKLEFVSSIYKVVQPGNNGEWIEELVGLDESILIGGTQTWLYHGGLSSMKYNIHSWRKSWNKVNDTDLQQRFINGGVRLGKHKGIGCKIKPRKNETKIGSGAYIDNAPYYESFFS